MKLSRTFWLISIVVIAIVLFVFRMKFVQHDNDRSRLENLLRIEFPNSTDYKIIDWAIECNYCFTAFIRFKADSSNYCGFIKENGLVDLNNDSCGYAKLLHEGKLLRDDSLFFTKDYFSIYPIQAELDTSEVNKIAWWKPSRDLTQNYSAYYNNNENHRISTNKTDKAVGRITTQYSKGFFYILIECKLSIN